MDGTVYPATVEEIDDAFNAGHIDEDTLVLAAGETQWKRLGALAGLDEAPSEVAPSVSAVSVSVPPSSAAPSSLPSSLRPLSFDLEPDADELAMRPRSRKMAIFGAFAGALAIGAVAFVVARTSGHPAAAAAAAPPPAPVVTAVADAVQAPASSSADPQAPRFSDEQKQKLIAADKAHEEQAKSKKKLRAVEVHHSPRTYKSQGFTTGGNKYDPLNASL